VQFETNPHPHITEYIASSSNRWQGAVIIFPGGGYTHHAEHEGKGYADFLLKHGISSFVSIYRTAGDNVQHPAMLEDALWSINYVKNRCKELNLNDKLVGVMGSSAGGHLASHAMSAWQNYSQDLRPAFGVLCYPVIDLVSEYANLGSRINLLGKNNSDTLASSISGHNMVHADTPPAFLWHTGEDQSVPIENSLFMALALSKYKIPFEMHTYHEGQHGLGLNTDHLWGQALVKWLYKF